MKILHIIPSYLSGSASSGPVVATHALNKELVNSGIEVTVYTTNFDGTNIADVPLQQEIMVDGVKIYYFPVTFKSWYYALTLHNALADTADNFDLIHITSIFLSASTLGAYYAKKYNKPYIISPHGSLMRQSLRYGALKKKVYINCIEKKNIKGAAAVHFTSQAEQAEFGFSGLAYNKCFVVPNGIDTDKGYNNTQGNLSKEFLEKYGISPNSQIILFMGRLHHQKGFDTLIPAFAEIVKRKPGAILVIVGLDDGYKQELMALISLFQLQGKVIFTGFLLGSDKLAAYQHAHVFVLLSYSENFGMVVLEAMAHQLPVVMSKAVGLAEKINQAEAGLVVEKNIEQVVAAVLQILDNPLWAAFMAERGRTLVLDQFSAKKVAAAMVVEYTAIFNNHKAYAY